MSDLKKKKKQENKEKNRSFKREMVDIEMKRQAKTMRLGDDQQLDQVLYIIESI